MKMTGLRRHQTGLDAPARRHCRNAQSPGAQRLECRTESHHTRPFHRRRHPHRRHPPCSGSPCPPRPSATRPAGASPAAISSATAAPSTCPPCSGLACLVRRCRTRRRHAHRRLDPAVASIRNCYLDPSSTPPAVIRYTSCEQYYVRAIHRGHIAHRYLRQRRGRNGP